MQETDARANHVEVLFTKSALTSVETPQVYHIKGLRVRFEMQIREKANCSKNG